MDILIRRLYRDYRGLEQKCIGQTKVERLRCVSGMVRIKLRYLKLCKNRTVKVLGYEKIFFNLNHLYISDTIV